MLTPKQENVLNKLSEYIAKNGQAPTIEEMQHTLGLRSKRWVVQYLEALEKKWFITRGRGYRAIKLWNNIGFQTMINIPILGVANAGRALTYAKQTDCGYLPVFKSIIKGKTDKFFVVKVEGTSMNKFAVNGKEIHDGAYALIDSTAKKVNAKDAFLFIVDGCATVKKFKKEGKNIYLLPESTDKTHHPLVISEADNLEVNGKVVDVFNF